MLQQLLHSLLISLVCIIWGLPVILLSPGKKGPLTIRWNEIILAFFTGLCLISLFAAWICLFLPLTWTLAAIATLCPLAILLILASKKLYRFAGINKQALLSSRGAGMLLFSLLAVLLFLSLGSNRPTMIDTGLYHLQIIRWNHEYGTTTGLANLFPRYGFYSNWLSLASLFALPFRQENFLAANIALSCWFLFFLIHKISHHLERYTVLQSHAILAWTYTIVLIISFMEWGLLRVNASSTSYDFIVTAVTLIVLLGIAEELLSVSTLSFYPLIILVAAVPFFKLSGVTIGIVLLAYLILTRKKFKSYMAFAGILLLFTIPYLYRNYLQTGYTLYPYTFIAGNGPDWRVPVQMTNRIARYITLNNKFFNQAIPESEWIQPSSKWIKSWFSHQPLLDKGILLLAAIGSLLYVIYPKKYLQKARGVGMVYISCFIALVIWFFVSPDPRFAYAYLLFAAALPFSIVARHILPAKSILLAIAALGIGIIIYGAGKFDSGNIIRPGHLPVPAITSPVINGTRYNLAQQGGETDLHCQYTELPCVYQLNPFLERRGEQLKEGFRMNKAIDSNFIIHYRY